LSGGDDLRAVDDEGIDLVGAIVHADDVVPEAIGDDPATFQDEAAAIVVDQLEACRAAGTGATEGPLQAGTTIGTADEDFTG
jgi:hypothetical protein